MRGDVDEPATEAWFPELIGDQGHNDEAKAVQVVAIVEFPLPVFTDLRPDLWEEPAIKDKADGHTREYEGKEPITPKEITPQPPPGTVFGNRPDTEISQDAFKANDAGGEGFEQDEGDQIPRNHQPGEYPAETQIEKGDDEDANPYSRGDGGGETARRK